MNFTYFAQRMVYPAHLHQRVSKYDTLCLHVEHGFSCVHSQQQCCHIEPTSCCNICCHLQVTSRNMTNHVHNIIQTTTVIQLPRYSVTSYELFHLVNRNLLRNTLLQRRNLTMGQIKENKQQLQNVILITIGFPSAPLGSKFFHFHAVFGKKVAK